MKVEDQLALILTKLDEQSKGISETNRRLHDVHDSVAELTAAHADFERWRPQVDGQVKDLRLTVDSLCQQLDDLKASSLEPGSAPFKVSGSAHLDPSCSTATPGPLGHGDATHHRSDGSGVVYMTTHEPPPVTDKARSAVRASQRPPITHTESRAHRGAAQRFPAMATTSVAASSPHPYLSRFRFRSRRRNPSATSRASVRGRLPPIRCSSTSSSPPPATGGEEGESGRRKLSNQSSWEAKDAEGDDYLYRLGKEADNLNVTVGARAGIVDDLFVGNFLGKDSDIVFDYRQKATRTFEYLQGDYYIAPAFLDKVACHIVKNYIAHLLNNIKVPLILGIWGGKGQGKTFQTELIFRAMGVEPVIMSAGELESEKAGEPGRLIRDRYRTASQVIQNQGKMSCLMINDLDAGVGRFGNTQMTVNNQIAVGTLMNLADNPNRVSIGQKWRESDVTHRVPIIVTGNDFSTLYAPLIRDGRMEKFYWQPTREDIISIVHGMYRKDGLSVEEVARVVDAFPNQALDFYGALRSRTYDQAILEWVEEIGGHEQLSVKLLKRKKGEELPTFIPPKPSLEALIESGYSLVKEQELIMNSKLSKEYMKNLE